MSATIDVFTRGNKIIVRAEWRTESVAGSGTYDTLTDPTTITFTARQRTLAGLLQAAVAYVFGVAPEVTKVATGIYEFAHVPAPGRWYVHAQGTGAAQGAEKVTYEIDESEALAA